MGIKNLFQIIKEEAPDAIKEGEIKNQFGRKVAIDASMSIYSFMIAVRSEGQQLMNEDGATTSHIMGMFYRTLRMVENGIKPLYVFDGAPPKLKSGELAKRFQRKAEANESLEEAKETGTAEEVEKFSRRTVRVTREHNEECQQLLKFMGIPYIIAPTEAEAQCAVLARAGKVYAAASEDMDTLCFDSPILLRHLTFSEQRKEPIQEIHVQKVLEGLQMERPQFVDLCILLGCDYLDPIPKIGPSTALKLIRSTTCPASLISSATIQRRNTRSQRTGHLRTPVLYSLSPTYGRQTTRCATSSGRSQMWRALSSFSLSTATSTRTESGVSVRVLRST